MIYTVFVNKHSLFEVFILL